MWIMGELGWRWMDKYCSNENHLQGVFVAQSIEKVRRGLAPRTERFIAANDGSLPNYAFRGVHFAEPLLGAFGEKL